MKEYKIVALLFFSFYSSLLTAQSLSLDWVKRIGGSSHDFAQHITVDASGNVITGGAFTGSVDFDPNAGVNNITSLGVNDIFIQKLGSDGSFSWARSFGVIGDMIMLGSMTVDDNGNVYTTGWFGNTVDFDPGPGVYDVASTGSQNIFIHKMDANGNFLWVKQMGDFNLDRGCNIRTDNQGNVYLIGDFIGTVDFDPGTGMANLSSTTQGSDAFILKLDTNGNFIWVKQLGGTEYDRGESIVIDQSGNIYTSGFFEETVDFDPGPGISNLTSTVGGSVFLQKLDANGDFLWAKKMAGNPGLGGFGWGACDYLAVDDLGSVYFAGYFMGTVDFEEGSGANILTSNGQKDIFVQKFDTNGNFLWVRQIGGSFMDQGESVSVDSSGDLIVTGYFHETVDFDPGFGNMTLTSNGGSDIFLLKLDADGNYKWASNIGSAYNDSGLSITADEQGNIYTTGNFIDVVDFDPGPNLHNVVGQGNVYTDIYVLKLTSGITGMKEMDVSERQMVRIVNLMGVESNHENNAILIYVYDDGSTEKVFKVE